MGFRPQSYIYAVNLYGRMVLETDPSIIAGKVATHTMDADAPLSEQVLQTLHLLSFGSNQTK